MRTLIVGVGALGGTIAARLRAAGCPVWLATRNADAAAVLKTSGLQVTGIGGDVSVDVQNVAVVTEYGQDDRFDLIVLATKARDAIDIAPRLMPLLAPAGTLLPIQNGGVSQMLVEQLGNEHVLGGLSNLGATMVEPGVYEQRNAGHLLIGEMPDKHGRSGELNGRAERVQQWLGQAVEVRVTANLHGAIWSKLLVNCSVTTIGAIAGRTMRGYIELPDGRELFDRTYDEALSIGLASGARPERMLVEPVPPNWNAQSRRSVASEAHDAWLGEILQAYGDLKPSMLQDFERGRVTEIDFINGYVARLGEQLGIPTPLNAAIVATVHAITRNELTPSPALLAHVLRTSCSCC